MDQSTLVHNTSEDLYILTDEGGNQLRFHDFSSAWSAAERGQFVSFTDPAGNVIAVTDWTASGQVEEVQRSTPVGGSTLVESWQYSYLGSSDPNAGLLSGVTLRRSTNGGSSWSTMRQVAYTYFDGSQNFGNRGDLMTAVVKDAANNVLDTTYYRYYTPAEVAGGANGYVHGLKFVIGPSAFPRLAAAVGNPFTASDAQVAPYANQFLEYDSQLRIAETVVQGQGSSGNGGQGTFTYNYTTSSNTDGFNSWKTKTVETLPDGNQNIVYTNAYGQPMLSIFKDVATGQEWKTFNQYDGAGRLILTANPSAVSGYSESYADLLHMQSGNFEYLRDSAGLITTISYYLSTTATDTTAGGVLGYQQAVNIQQGETSSIVPQSALQYFVRTEGGATVAPVATETVYRNDNGTGGLTTSYSYTWFSGTTQIESITVTHPTIASGQNGPGTADEEITFFSAFGQMIWSKDADGFLSYFAYDVATGALTKMIGDVDTEQDEDFVDLPDDWETPGGGGLHLVTEREVDALGRATKVTAPNGNISYTVYRDASHEVRTYAGWNAATDSPTGPIVVSRVDRAAGYAETLTMSATPHLTSDRPDGTEAISSLQTLSRSYVSAGGQVSHTDDYFNLNGLSYSTSTNLGTQGTHFYRTLYAYDSAGRQDRVATPNGTIYRTVFDSLGRAVSSWVGLDDTPTSGSWSPSNTAGTDLVKVTENVYDGGGIGDSNLTQTTAYPGGGADNRVSRFYFDWRSRLVASKGGIQGSEAADTQRPITYSEYNNLGQVVAQEQYDGDDVSITDGNSDGVPDKPSSSLRRARSTFEFDDQGRLFRSHVFSVDQDDGTLSTDSLTSESWFDHRGNVIKSSAPGGLVTKFTYDSLGRVVKEYITDGGDDEDWADAGSVADDIVLEQTESEYDANSNVILVTSRQRFHDETDPGELGDPATGPLARVYYTAYYYDLADRLTATVDVGTNGGAAYERPEEVPGRSDTALVVSQTYNAAGWLETVTDPRGTVKRTEYDALGRTTRTIDHYVNGTPSTADDHTTAYTYDGNDNLLTVSVLLPSSAVQETQFVYAARISTGSALNSNDIRTETRYPDPSSGAASSAEKTGGTVNALGQELTTTDRNGTEHTFTYDVLGRLVADAVTDLGSGVDDAVLRIETAYDTAGRAYLVTSFDAASGGDPVNQVLRQFNGLGQLTAEYQEHAGEVDTETTPKVQYAYAEMASGANHSRLVSMTYPDGRVLAYNYASGLDATISRLTSLSDNSGTLEAFSYLGLGTVVRRAHPEPDIDLTYIKLAAEDDGDAGDKYIGLDRFGRIADQRWLDTGTDAATDRFQYGHDRNGNRLFRANLVDAAFSELYQYDALDQLTGFARGELNEDRDAIEGTAARTQAWSLDAVGNWTSLSTDGTPQARTHNAQNELTAVGGNALTYDASGNLTTDAAGRMLIYDAWNRLVEVQDAEEETLVRYGFDGLNRRIAEDTGTTKDLYYSAAWQVLEEQVGGEALVQHVWSPVYVDALVLRDRDTDANGSLDERLYVQQDANWNVTALVDASGAVVERFAFDPFGKVAVLEEDWDTKTGSDFDWQYLFQGLRRDETTGFDQARNREYFAELGRWLQRDPMQFAAGDVNFYRFVGNMATNATDPSGLETAEQIRSNMNLRLSLWRFRLETDKSQAEAKIENARQQLKLQKLDKAKMELEARIAFFQREAREAAAEIKFVEARANELRNATKPAALEGVQADWKDISESKGGFFGGGKGLATQIADLKKKQDEINKKKKEDRKDSDINDLRELQRQLDKLEKQNAWMREMREKLAQLIQAKANK